MVAVVVAVAVVCVCARAFAKEGGKRVEYIIEASESKRIFVMATEPWRNGPMALFGLYF